MSREIPLTKGFVAIVDDADFDWLNQWSWCATPQGYATRHLGERTRIRMHNQIMEPLAGMVVDHIDHDPTNNVRANLRVCTHAENVWNRRHLRDGFRGVRLIRHCRRFQASVSANGVTRTSGLYATAIGAALAYDEMAREAHGEFASLNFPDLVMMAPPPLGKGYLSAEQRAQRQAVAPDWAQTQIGEG